MNFPLDPRLTLAAMIVSIAGCAGPGGTPPDRMQADSPTPSAPASYVVHANGNAPLRLSAQLDISNDHATARTAYVRGVGFGLASQVFSPSCDGVALLEAGNGHWQVPDGCNTLHWLIDVQTAAPDSVDAAKQLSTYFPDNGWWLLSEPTSLLRTSGSDEDQEFSLKINLSAAERRISGATPLEQGLWRVPPVNGAPEFYAFGNLSRQQHDFGLIKTTYVVDHARRFDELPLSALHRQSLEYLLTVFQVPDGVPPKDRHLLVVWLGMDETSGVTGGAAGSRSFIANYVVGHSENQDINAARTLLVVAHEQTHQLHDLMWQGGSSLPAWMHESLAHYYGLKALARSGISDAAVAVPTNRFIDANRPVEAGLVEWERRHRLGNPQAYAMFLSQGATFWSEVDRVLQEQALVPNGLDSLIPELMKTDGSRTGLPASFQSLLLEKGGARIQDLIDKFIEN